MKSSDVFYNLDGNFMMMPCQIDQQKVQQQGTASNSEDGRIAEQTGNSGAKQRAKYGAGRLK